MPPTHARSLSAYVNHLPALQLLVDLGVDLYEVKAGDSKRFKETTLVLQVDKLPKIGAHMLRLDVERDIKPRLLFLRRQLGVSADEIGSYLTRNPHFLLQNLADLNVRSWQTKLRLFDCILRKESSIFAVNFSTERTSLDLQLKAGMDFANVYV